MHVEPAQPEAAPKRKRGGLWRRVEREWVEHPVFASLPPSAKAAYIQLLVICHPEHGLGLSGKELGVRLGRDERTARRTVQLLEQQGLLRVRRTSGGAHRDCNRYWVLPVPGGDVRAEWAERKAAQAARLAAKAAEKAASKAGAGVDEIGAPILTPSTGSPVAPAAPVEPTAPPRPQLAADVRARLAELVARDRHLSIEAAHAELDGYGEGTLHQLAAYYDLGEAPPAEDPRRAGTPQEQARRMVEEYLRAWDLQRAPMRRELSLAAQVIAQSGEHAWSRYDAAQRRLASLVLRRRYDRPFSMLYLQVHLEAEGLPKPERPKDG